MAREFSAGKQVPDAVQDRGREALEGGVRVRGLARAGITTGELDGEHLDVRGEACAPVVKAPRSRASLREAEETKARRPGARGTRALFGTAKDPRAVRVHRCGARDEGR